MPLLPYLLFDHLKTVINRGYGTDSLFEFFYYIVLAEHHIYMQCQRRSGRDRGEEEKREGIENKEVRDGVEAMWR